MGKLIDTGLYNEVKNILDRARSRAYTAVNSAMVEAYWHIGRLIVERQGGGERAEYGLGLINSLAERLTAEYSKGFTASNLKYMRQFYLQFQNRHALRDLSKITRKSTHQNTSYICQQKMSFSRNWKRRIGKRRQAHSKCHQLLYV